MLCNKSEDQKSYKYYVMDFHVEVMTIFSVLYQWYWKNREQLDSYWTSINITFNLSSRYSTNSTTYISPNRVKGWQMSSHEGITLESIERLWFKTQQPRTWVSHYPITRQEPSFFKYWKLPTLLSLFLSCQAFVSIFISQADKLCNYITSASNATLTS